MLRSVNVELTLVAEDMIPRVRPRFLDRAACTQWTSGRFESSVVYSGLFASLRRFRTSMAPGVSYHAA